ncbi:hypothetical protein pb186bvf_010231 [Paramecium bursaria]
MNKNSYDTNRYALKQYLKGKKHNDCQTEGVVKSLNFIQQNQSFIYKNKYHLPIIKQYSKSIKTERLQYSYERYPNFWANQGRALISESLEKYQFK